MDTWSVEDQNGIKYVYMKLMPFWDFDIDVCRLFILDLIFNMFST